MCKYCLLKTEMNEKKIYLLLFLYLEKELVTLQWELFAGFGLSRTLNIQV